MAGKVRIVLDYDGDGTCMWVMERDVNFDAGDASTWTASMLLEVEATFDTSAAAFGVPQEKWRDASHGERVES